MIAVRLEDGSTVYGFGAGSVAGRNASATPDPYWQRAAEASVQECADIYGGLIALPGARLIHAGPVRPTSLDTPRTPVESKPKRQANKSRR